MKSEKRMQLGNRSSWLRVSLCYLGHNAFGEKPSLIIFSQVASLALSDAPFSCPAARARQVSTQRR